MEFYTFFTQSNNSLKIYFTSQKIGICFYTKSESTFRHLYILKKN